MDQLNNSPNFQAMPFQALIVDSEFLIRKYIASCIIPTGFFETIHADSLQEALQFAAEKKPLVIIFDLMLSDVHPDVFIQHLRSLSIGYYPYMIATSIIKDDERTKKAYESGADYYLEKNFKSFELIGILRNIVRHYQNSVQISESEFRYRSLFNLTNEPMLLIDIKKNMVVEFNSAAKVLFDIEINTSETKSLVDISLRPEEIIMLLNQKHTFIAGLQLKKSDESPFLARASFVYFMQSDNAYVLMSVNDLSDDLRAIEERNAFDKLAKKSDKKAYSELVLYLAGEENERRRISREIHDHVGQMMVSVKLSIEGILFQCVDIQLNKNLTLVRDRIVDAIWSIRNIAHKIEQESDSVVDLKTRLSNLIKNIHHENHIQLIFDWKGDLFHHTSFVESNIFRICEESLTNVIKHASEGKASMLITNENNLFQIDLISQGIKKRVNNRNSGMGIRIMQQRAALIGAEIQFAETDYLFKVNLKFDTNKNQL